MSKFLTLEIEDGTGVTVTQNDPTCQRYSVCKSKFRTPSAIEGQLLMACLLEAAKIQNLKLFMRSYHFLVRFTGISSPDEPRVFYDRQANVARSLTDVLLLELQSRDAAWVTQNLQLYLSFYTGYFDFEKRLRKRACNDRLAWRQQAVWSLIIERAWDVIDNDAHDPFVRSFLKDRPGLRERLLQSRAETEATSISDAIDDAQAQGDVVQDVGRDVTVSAARRL